MARGSLLMSLLLMAVSIPAGAALHDIPEGYVRVAEQHGVPAEVLYAVSLTETAMV
ncbi:transglycosylase, partial [Escherichia coli]|nr:transglycosylase [Escherichia coli]HAU8044779.1 transglycosylase [Escherichia coli]HAW4104049.1 transglycosylase [Escherichia coli]HAX2429189.1 transglycosylase [Escherichia coli]HAX6831575.1 transglycosylase [Escherichia coli]